MKKLKSVSFVRASDLTDEQRKELNFEKKDGMVAIEVWEHSEETTDKREEAKQSFLKTLNKGQLIWLNELYIDKQKVRDSTKKYLYYDAAGMNAPRHLSVKDFEKELKLGDD